MRPPETQRRPGQGAVAMITGNEIAAEHSPPARPTQLVDDLGHRPPKRRSPVVGVPRLARPGWYRLAADRWSEPRL
jgi:hypothetical protein